jgi:hypothetical protein
MDVEVAGCLSSPSIHAERHARRGLHARSVQNRVEDLVVVEAINQALVQCDLVCHRAINHFLVQVGRAKSSDVTAEHDVVTVARLGKVTKEPACLG